MRRLLLSLFVVASLLTGPTSAMETFEVVVPLRHAANSQLTYTMTVFGRSSTAVAKMSGYAYARLTIVSDPTNTANPHYVQTVSFLQSRLTPERRRLDLALTVQGQQGALSLELDRIVNRFQRTRSPITLTSGQGVSTHPIPGQVQILHELRAVSTSSRGDRKEQLVGIPGQSRRIVDDSIFFRQVPAVFKAEPIADLNGKKRWNVTVTSIDSIADNNLSLAGFFSQATLRVQTNQIMTGVAEEGQNEDPGFEAWVLENELPETSVRTTKNVNGLDYGLLYTFDLELDAIRLPIEMRERKRLMTDTRLSRYVVVTCPNSGLKESVEVWTYAGLDAASLSSGRRRATFRDGSRGEREVLFLRSEKGFARVLSQVQAPAGLPRIE